MRLLLRVLPLLLLFPILASAAPFQNASVRFDRAKIGISNPTILVVASPATVAVENKVTLQFASGLGVDSTASNITVSNAGLPADYQGTTLTPWPGVGSAATGVAGQTVTIASGDLATGTLYGFYITAGITSPVSAGEYTHTLTTKTVANATIDTTQLTTVAVADDQVRVTGTIAPTVVNAEITVNIASETDDAYVPPATEREYTVTYRNASSTDASFTLEANWTMAERKNSGMRNFEAVSYVPGSAQKAHDGAQPFIDLDTRTIRWEIINLPANTLKKVAFKLKTADASLSAEDLYYLVRTLAIANSSVVDTAEIGQVYSPQGVLQPPATPRSALPTPSQVPGAETPLPSQVPAPTFTPSPDSFRITDVRLVAVTDTSFSVRVRTNRPARIAIDYGVTTELGQRVEDTALSAETVLTITGLSPGTLYYFRPSAQDTIGTAVTLDELFTVRTASQGLPAGLLRDRVTISAQGVLLRSGAGVSASPVTLPVSTPIEVILPFANDADLDVHVRIVNPKVLGLRTPAVQPFVEYSRLLKTAPRIFSGHLMTPSRQDTYAVAIEVRDSAGNRYQDTLLQLRMATPLQIVTDSGHGIEAAQVTLERFNDVLQYFEPFPLTSYGSAETLYSKEDGSVRVVLPAGRYNVATQAIGFAPYRQEFAFSPATDLQYPRLVITRAPWGIRTYIKYYASTIADTYHLANWHNASVATSSRYMALQRLLGVSLAIVLAALLINQRVRTPRLVAHRSLAAALTALMHSLASLLVGILLFMQVLLLLHVGFIAAWPLLLLTCLNGILWTALQWQRWQKTSVSY